MGRLKSRTALLGLLFTCLISFSALGHASASSISYKGITLTPAVISIDLHKDEPTASFTINITNNTETAQTLYASSLDFRSLNETGGVAFVGNSANQLTDKHGLASWIDVGKTPIVLMPHVSKDVKVTIENRADLAPGGHYAAVLFNTSTTDASLGTNRVAINQVVSTLVFASKLDGANYGIKLVKNSVSGNLLQMPQTADIVFQNTGDIQEVPRGFVTVTSPFSHEVFRGIINPDSNLVLPDSRRLYQVKLLPTGTARWPGIYHVTVRYRYDSTVTVQQASASFWYVSPIWIGVVLAVLLLAWAGTYKRAVIRRYFQRRSRAKRTAN